MIDKYELRTHHMPALICAAPFIAYSFYFVSGLDLGFLNAILAQAVAGVGTVSALYYLEAFTCRHIGKMLEDRMFSRGRDFPTTQFLLDADTHCSPERKQEIKTKILSDFGVDLTGRTVGTSADRQLIHEVIGKIRQKFYKKNDAILQRNIYFGFSKNIAGGAIVSALTSILLSIVALFVDNMVAFQVAIGLAILYTVICGFGLWAMTDNARRYAETLFDEFLAN